MKEFYIETNSFAAPFCSDTDFCYIRAKTPAEALEKCVKQYKHPCGLYAAVAYSSADARNKGQKPLAKWLSNHEIALRKEAEGKGAYVVRGNGPGEFVLDGKKVIVENPMGGEVMECE